MIVVDVAKISLDRAAKSLNQRVKCLTKMHNASSLTCKAICLQYIDAPFLCDLSGCILRYPNMRA